MAVKLVAGLLKDYDRDPPARVPAAYLVGCGFPAIPGLVQDVSYTPVLPERFRLLTFTFWFSYVRGGAVTSTSWHVCTGLGTPPDFPSMIAWERVLPIYLADAIGICHSYDESAAYSFDCGKVYTGAERRFGIAIAKNSTNSGQFFAAFQIQEL